MLQVALESSLREQIGSRGLFARVALILQTSDQLHDEVTIGFAESVGIQWRDAVIVGVRCGIRCLPRKWTHRKHCAINVTAVDWHPGDTTDMVVTFVAAKAILAICDAPPPGAPAFVKEFGLFVFAK